MSDYEFIKRFTNIRISDICKELEVSSSNVSSGKISNENLRKVKNKILEELLELIKEDEKEVLISLYLYNEIIERLEKENRMLREMI